MIDEQHIFNDRYRLDTTLGEGGMAVVFCGTDTLLRRRVAIKVLRPQYASDEEFVRRFYQEAESAARLSHPNIVNTYDVGREGETYYIVMELVDGPSLADVIGGDGRIPEPVAIDYAAQICSGLAYAHRQGLLHRDVKPANILLTKDDVVKLSDFGIARAVSQQTMAMTRPGLVMGSVYYLSPEQAQGHELRETSDLYSVGVVLYQMLTGRLPYTGESPVTVALRHVSDPVPDLSGEPDVSPALAAIVNRLMQKIPEHRFGSAIEVATALREARERPSVPAYETADDSGVHAGGGLTPPPRPSRFPDRASASVAPRRWSPAALIALIVVLALAGAAAGYIFVASPFSNTPKVALDNYVGMTDAQATQAIVGLRLSYTIDRTPSDTVAVNRVISQDPAGGVRVFEGSTVTLTVSTGKPIVGLRNVTGFTVHDAQSDLSSDGMNARIQRRYDRAIPRDVVIAQNPKPGSKLREGSTVGLIVSNGPPPAPMPKLEGLTFDAAQALANKDGFTLVAQRAAIAGVAPNVISSQDYPAGKSIAPGANPTVTVLVSTGGGLTQVPDVTGDLYADATAALQQAGFQVATPEYAVEPASADNGKIIGEQPQGGASAPKGSSVQLVLSISGEVPDTEGMALGEAKTLLIDYGYQVGNITPTTQGAGGRVVGTEPEAGTNLRPGSPVNIYINAPQAQPSS